MKKTYQTPEMQLLDMETASVIATSLTIYSDDDAATTDIQLEGRRRGVEWSNQR